MDAHELTAAMLAAQDAASAVQGAPILEGLAALDRVDLHGALVCPAEHAHLTEAGYFRDREDLLRAVHRFQQEVAVVNARQAHRPEFDREALARIVARCHPAVRVV